MGIFDIFSAKKSILGIDIGSSSIKIVQLKKEGAAIVLENYSEIAIGPYLGKKIGQSVAEIDAVNLANILSILFKESNITTKEGAMSIPFRYSLVTLIDIPALSDDKIAQAVPFEAKKYIPVPLSEVSIDWFVVPKALLDIEENPLFNDGKILNEEKELRKISLIAIHNKELIKYNKVIEKLGLKIKKMEIEIFSSLRSISLNNRSIVVMVDIGAKTTKYYLLDHNIILSSVYSQKGGETITDAIIVADGGTFEDAEYKKRTTGLNGLSENSRKVVDLFIEETISEIKSLIQTYETKNRKTIGKIIFTGGGSVTKGLIELIQTRFDISVELANSFERVKTPEYLDSRLKELGPQFSVSVGVALKLLNN